MDGHLPLSGTLPFGKSCLLALGRQPARPDSGLVHLHILGTAPGEHFPEELRSYHHFSNSAVEAGSQRLQLVPGMHH